MATKKKDSSPKMPDDVATIARLERQIAELTEALQRERADATNLRRRHDEQIAQLKNVVKANVVRDLLPVIDNFERSLKHTPKEEGQASKAKGQENSKLLDWIDGVTKILKQFEKALAGLGVEKIKTVGELFDPRYHEAVSMEDGDGTHEIVAEELQSGYKLGDDVIRHAMVKVKMG
jgi:molecular chaperone GrpE